MKTKVTLKNFLLKILGEGNEKMIDLVTPKVLGDLEFTTRDFLREQAVDFIFGKILNDLRNNEGDRLKIIKKSMKKTPFDYYFRLILDFESKKCSRSEDHLFYYFYLDADARESSSCYRCLYCGVEEESSARSQFEGNIVRCQNARPRKIFQEGKKLLMGLIKNNPTEKEVRQFAELIVGLAI